MLPPALPPPPPQEATAKHNKTREYRLRVIIYFETTSRTLSDPALHVTLTDSFAAAGIKTLVRFAENCIVIEPIVSEQEVADPEKKKSLITLRLRSTKWNSK